MFSFFNTEEKIRAEYQAEFSFIHLMISLRIKSLAILSVFVLASNTIGLVYSSIIFFASSRSQVTDLSTSSFGTKPFFTETSCSCSFPKWLKFATLEMYVLAVHLCEG
jgi:hypothetical protein